MNEVSSRQWGLLLYVDRWADPEITTDGLYSLTRHGDGGTPPLEICFIPYPVEFLFDIIDILPIERPL
jgi:hypothetical protein